MKIDRAVPAGIPRTLACCLGLAIAAPAPAENLLGFDATGSSAELAAERRLDAGIDPADLRAWLKDLSAGINNVGSPHDRRNAEKMRDMLASWGWAAHILPYVEESSLQVDLKRDITDAFHNQTRITPIAVFRCPSDSVE